MAKTVKEKLQAALESAVDLIEKAEIGDQQGQYPQESVDALKTGIDFAKDVYESEEVDEDAQKSALDAIGDAFKAFKATVIKPEKPKEPEKATLKGVVLKGDGSQKKGTHSLFIGKRIVTFVDGKAELPADLADEVIKAGYAE